MKHKTAELEGALLDAAVAKAVGVAWTLTDQDIGRLHVRAALDWPRSDESVFEPSSDWADGGPIIERERKHAQYRFTSTNNWQAVCCDRLQYGPTMLIAAMRAFVASKLGDEVEL